MEGIVGLIKQKYVILGDKRHLIANEQLLPGDKIRYIVNKNNILINDSLLERSDQTHLGIVKNISDVIHISIPGLPKYLDFTFPYFEGVEINSVCILYFSKHSENTQSFIHIVKHYGSIRNRAIDKDLFCDLYEYIPNTITPIYTDHVPFIDKSLIDLTHLPTFTVDPDGSKDQDDAISVSLNKIYVHIVDAHNQIEPLSSIDKNSLRNSFTLYLSERIHNIIPDNLAEDKLSLRKDQMRNTITVEYLIDPTTYNILSSSIYRATIKVKNQYTYDAYMENLDPFLLAFCNRWKYNSLPLPNVIYNVDKTTGELINTQCVYNNDYAHKIVETLMILTNLTISKHTNSAIPQRFHDKIKTPIENVEYTANPAINALITIKNYKPALYDNIQKGHFGLGLETYTHFTSPIRRYADVVVHRYLSGKGYENLQEVLTHINIRERNIDKTLEMYRRVKLLSYFEKNAKKIWTCFVLYSTHSGVCVVLEENMFECFVFTEEKYQIGIKLNIKIKSVDWCSLTSKSVIV
jgi:ribonuclease R